LLWAKGLRGGGVFRLCRIGPTAAAEAAEVNPVTATAPAASFTAAATASDASGVETGSDADAGGNGCRSAATPSLCQQPLPVSSVSCVEHVRENLDARRENNEATATLFFISVSEPVETRKL
jgi:hypothetical protein